MRSKTLTAMGDVVTTERVPGGEHVTVETAALRVDFAELELRVLAAMEDDSLELADANFGRAWPGTVTGRSRP